MYWNKSKTSGVAFLYPGFSDVRPGSSFLDLGLLGGGPGHPEGDPRPTRGATRPAGPSRPARTGRETLLPPPRRLQGDDEADERHGDPETLLAAPRGHGGHDEADERLRDQEEAVFEAARSLRGNDEIDAGIGG